MTALEYMEKQLLKHRLNYNREVIRGVPEDMRNNLLSKIGYFEAAVEALRMENILLNETRDIDFDYEAEDC